MKVLKLSLLALGMGLSGLAQADVIGVKGDLSYWAYDGQANMAAQTAASDQDLERKGAAQLSLAIEHPVPLIPNAKIRYVNLKTQTENEVAGQPVYDIDMDHADFILYYEILDNIVNADVGVGATTLNGHVTTLALSKTDIDKTVPVIYATAGAKLPFTGLSAKGEVLYSNFNDAKITDAQAELQYNFIDNLLVDVGLKAGYRILDIKLDDYEKNDLKFNFKGPYIGLDIHF
ncbi:MULTISPECIES: TIGR04219 family outer membrane beta-barrel protein [Acinetobacter]|jgi:outer membrane protein|uniref:TIGR04219 family outer membrane beta-barrel protein n=1 Tax=Acinetobacter TaxID=469 RepID=UPI002447E012|nr:MULTISPECIES: TIGR04219 family outer membrane beta-barrel protein [Acinetobacter]MDH0032719.1 TIGR04219 family outer membrane beta-barrel protein [Acinetobacter sp. GD04021]MDH0888154.1 TIGR04219 family outer membrane beta-barrel protein [Acinetobacter sp. GD03873]MDH1084505.1 TIGR04219 family outer membrane beta-barrel protein [Acinetobacter sp. GD03983]MDH2191471.1 TIGR04219 family outer membrane beta-barrel protein [Acinetobacter sp. GD03645]MDH2205044.1 TIGR04219 family outer membrane b